MDSVNLTLVLNELDGIKQTDLAYIAEMFAGEKYPNLGELPPTFTLTEPVNLFRNTTFPSPQSDLPALRAISLSSEGADWHLRLQDTRLSVEWKHQSDQYPRFPELKVRFTEALEIFEKALDDRGFVQRTYKQVEITYLNLLPTNALSEVLRIVNPLTISFESSNLSYIPLAESLKYVYGVNDQSATAGRIYFDCYPFDESKLVARIAFFAALKETSKEQLTRVLELGHLATNEWFNNITLEPLQISKWGKEFK